ncbi:MAG: hypothetical protein R6U22_00875, partial [Desulfohalobiaceae bacterium]
MLKEYTEQLRKVAQELLEQGKVDCFIGYRQGSVPLRDAPFVAYSAQEAQELVWSSFCTANLAKLLIGRSDRAGIVAQGCVSRNIVGLIQENQVKRENIHVVGICSPAMVDHRKVQAKFPDKFIQRVEEDQDYLYVYGQGLEESLLKRDVRRNNCYTCAHRNPVIYDQLLGELGPETWGGDIDKVAAPWENLSADERWQRFEQTFQDCIRCYACRDVCPLCYCNQCFVDENRPQWCGKSQDEADIYTFHILRAFHCAGRCTDCGAC